MNTCKVKYHRNSDKKKQATENHNKTTALERSLMNYWGLKLVLRAPHPQFLKWNKTNDTVSRDGLFENNGKVWFSTQVHSHGSAISLWHAVIDGEYFEPFPMTRGLQQGYVMAQTLFSMILRMLFRTVILIF